jgi:hypothetical protein
MLKITRILTLTLGVMALSVASMASANTMEAPCTYDRYTGMNMTLIDRNYTLIGGMPDMADWGFPWSPSLYKFDISALAEPVQSAALEVEKIDGDMRQATATNRLQVYAVDLLSDVETWPVLDESQYGDVIDTVVMGDNGFYSFDVTSLVNDWISGAKDNNGMALIVMSTSDWLDYDEDINPAAYVTLAGVPDPVEYPETLGAAPVIVTTPVPEPATLGLLALGGVVVLRRRRAG